MHIPSVISTSVIDVLPFEEALAAALVPVPEYRVEDWLYVPNRYEEYRYILGTRGKNPVICVGINPSTAAPGALDPTLKSAERIAHANGHDSFLMFNETFSGTDDVRGCELTLKAADRIKEIDAFGLFVTHFHEVSKSWRRIE